MNTFAYNQNHDTLPEKMKALVKDLIESSKQLQAAIIKRDTSIIWKILSQQQEKVSQFEQYKYLWCQIMSDKNIRNDNLKNSKAEVDAQIIKLRETNQSNATLIQAFLSAIRKALKKVDSSTPAHNPVYSSKGKMKFKSSSRIINSVG